MATYAVGDIHGCFSEWIALKDKIEAQDKDAQFILVGDIIDRGQETLDMLDWAIENVTDNGKYQMILGNHESEKIDWKNRFLKQLIDQADKKGIDPIDLLCEYNDRYNFVFLHKIEIEYEDNPLDCLVKHIEWMETLPLFKDIAIDGKRFIIAHANIPKSMLLSDGTLKKDVTDHEKQYVIWDRSIQAKNVIPDSIMVYGHTPTVLYHEDGIKIDNPGRIHVNKLHNKYNIDCGLVYKQYYPEATLAALNLNTLEEIYLHD